MTRVMNAIQPAVSRVLGYANPARLGLPANLFQSDVVRTSVAGAVLFGVAGAGLGVKGAMNAFGVQATAAGATVRMDWGYDWMAWAIIGAFVGALVGAGAAYLVKAKFAERGVLTALLAVGTLGGLAAGASWGNAVARERVFEMRAQPTNTRPVPVPKGAEFSVTNGPIRLSGSVARTMNYPLLAFMVVAGTLLGQLAARGLVEVAPFRAAENGNGQYGAESANGNGAAPRQSRRAA